MAEFLSCLPMPLDIHGQKTSCVSTLPSANLNLGASAFAKFVFWFSSLCVLLASNQCSVGVVYQTVEEQLKLVDRIGIQ